MDLEDLLKEKARKTCLSSPVLNLFSESSNSSCTYEDFILDDGTLNLPKITPVLDGIEKSGNTEIHKFAKLVKVISPSFPKSYDILSSTNSDDGFGYLTNVNDNFKLCLPLLQSQDENNIILANLIMVSCLERALGNLLLLKSTNNWVPPLLKDLLSHPDLCSLIGLPLILCLKTVIGPPTSLNTRNLLWHGFVFPGELNPKFGFFLISLVKSIQCVIDQKDIDSESIPSRNLTIYSESNFIYDMPTLTNEDLNCMLNVFTRSPVVFDALNSLWRLTFKLFQENRVAESAILIMYLMENFLRLIYAQVNDCNVRILSAQSHELYTTYSEILMEHLPNSTQTNKFITYFPQSLLEMLMDLLFNQHGPRLRDRLSHGQVDLSNFPKCIAKYALSTARGKLRQRQRQNFEKMKKFTSTLCENFIEILSFLVSTHSMIIRNPDNFEGSVRLFKRFLQNMQNLNSHISDNKWELVHSLTQEIGFNTELISVKHGVSNDVAVE